jgi:methylmalonyl-CoA/ethylmalonyl-CoA epimerase
MSSVGGLAPVWHACDVPTDRLSSSDSLPAADDGKAGHRTAGAVGGINEADGSLTDIVLAIDHVGTAVPDLDAAVAFYTQIFGMVERHREVNVEQGVAEAMLVPTSAPEGSTQIQLLAPLTPESTIARFIDRSGPGLQQLAYRVPDVDQVAEVLRRRGVRLLYEAAKRGTNNTKINFVHPKDAGGVLIELVQDDTHSDNEAFLGR